MKHLSCPALSRALAFALLLALVAGCMPERRDNDPGPDVTASEDASTNDVAADADSAGTTDTVQADTAKADTTPLPVGCDGDEDCAKFPTAICQSAVCDTDTGLCKLIVAIDGTPCGDNAPCVADATCLAGACTGTTLDCDDDNPCTTDTCLKGSGCKSSPNTVVCDDKNPCTEGDSCSLGVCKGKVKACPGGKPPCLLASCDTTGTCVLKPVELTSTNTVTCDDGNPCTEATACKGGACVGTPKVCADDGNPCTLEACLPTKGGCLTAPLELPVVCDDGDACTTASSCQGGACKGEPTNCDDKDGCTVDTCDSKTGCAHKPASDGAPCDDGSACTTNDGCTKGTCVGKDANCEDGNLCTKDSCDATSGCVHGALLGPCSDGDACTDADACAKGACSGKKVNCDDSNPCTQDSCGALGCVHEVIANGGACTGGQCWGGTCVVPKCGNTVCEYNETTSTCGGDCPAGGGQCDVADGACMANCASSVCSVEAAACAKDSACLDADSCLAACKDAACRYGCISKLTGPSVVALKASNACLSSKCAKNGWSGKNCKGGDPAFVACVGACQSAACFSEEAACLGVTGCAAIAKCVDTCSNGSATCIKDCFAKGTGEDVQLFDDLTVCMNLKCL